MVIPVATEKLIIFQKTYDFVSTWLFPSINRIPKYHKTILGKQMEELGLSILLLILCANKETGKKRIALQIKLSDDLDKLRILLRLTKDLRFMSIKQYSHGAQLLNEIGRVLTGWMRVRVEEKEIVAKQDQNMTLW